MLVAFEDRSVSEMEVDFKGSLAQLAHRYTDVILCPLTWNGRGLVIMPGADRIADQALCEHAKVMQDITLMKYVGIHPVIVHGGGPDITGFLKKVGKKSEFVSGLRVTDEETMEIVEMVLIGKVNSEIVNLLNRAGNRAIGLSGKDASLIQAKKKLAEVHKDGKVELVDIGHVGEVDKICATTVNDLVEQGYIPVIAPVGVDADGASYNINADYVAAEVAGALKAEKLLLRMSRVFTRTSRTRAPSFPR